MKSFHNPNNHCDQCASSWVKQKHHGLAFGNQKRFVALLVQSTGNFLQNSDLKLGFPRDGTSRCPFVPGQGQEQKSRDKLLSPGTSRDKITFPLLKKNRKRTF